ncbi:MAG: hypothetical protein K0S33_3165 [Bacteroidetes bacterium]|jgi:hypothetical protein|nr:hypothetical protein [Bacteroidota bacterium]
MSTKTTYVLSKEEIVSRLESLHFSFEEHHWESFQQSFQEVKVQHPANASKISAKLIAIPAFVVLAGVIIYFSINTLKSQNNTSDDTKVNIETASTGTMPSEELKPEVAKNEAIPEKKTETIAAPVVKAPAPKTITTVPVQPNNVAKTAVVNQVPETPANNTAKVIAAPQTSTVTASGAPVQNQVKPYRVFRKTAAKTVPAELVPNPEEDEVVIPEN